VAQAPDGSGEGLVGRVDGIATWINELDTRVRAAELATGDENTAKELRRAVEALSKHDPKLEKRLTNRVDVLADRLATLASTVSTTAASLARKDGEIASVRRELEEGNKRIEVLVRQLGKSVGADEVEKLRAAVRAVQAERPGRGTDARLDALGGKLEFLTERIDTLGTTVATTAAGLVGREGEIANLRQKLEDSFARIEQNAAELRRMQGSATLADRLDTLQAAVDTTSTGLAARERDIATVRGRIDEAYARVGTVVAGLQGSIATLSTQVASLQALPATTEQALATRAAELHGRVDGLADRVESLATSVESALTGLVDKGAEVAALEGHVDEANARVDAVVAELRKALDELPAPGSIDPEVERRLATLAGSIEAAVRQLSAVETASSVQAEDADARAATLERLLARGGERLDAVEHDRDAAAAQLTRVDEAWTEEREWVRSRLEALAAEQADASKAHEGFEPAVAALTARLDSMESDHSVVTAEIARISGALEAEHSSLHTELEGLAAALAEATAPTGEDPAQALNELAARLESVERDGAAVASEVARTAAFWASELEAIESKLDASTTPGAATVDEKTDMLVGELAGRLDEMERDRQAAAAEMARLAGSWHTERSSLEARLDELAEHLAEVGSDTRGAVAGATGEDEFAQLRVAIDGLRMRLASSEQELATLVGSRDLAARLDEVTRRLESVERAPIALAGLDAGPLPGDGRFRLELRALELRMEHAEAAARENREAVLVQLERLAARIEWRFQRLEAEYEARHPQAVGGGGQVVPLRPSAEV
jgi:chromosome segregation ATPase